MADHTRRQRKILDRYYKNFDAIKFQRLSELATDLYLAEGKKLDRLWGQVEAVSRRLEVPDPRIAELIRRRDPAMLVTRFSRRLNADPDRISQPEPDQFPLTSAATSLAISTHLAVFARNQHFRSLTIGTALNGATPISLLAEFLQRNFIRSVAELA